MKNPYINKDDLLQVYMSCGMEDPGGLYADEVDLFELTDALVNYLTPIIAREERKHCIEFVHARNPAVAEALREKRGDM